MVERGDANATKENGINPLTLVDGSTTSYQDVGLSVGTKYKYRICAYEGDVQSGYTPIDSGTTYDANNLSILPGIPQRFTGQPYCNSADLYWLAPSSGPAPESYNIKRSTQAIGPFVTVGCTTATSTYYRCPNLLNGTPYYFQVTAVNSYGQSAASSIISVTPTVEPINAGPSTLILSNIGPSMMTLSWTDNSDDELWFKVQYSYTINVAGDLVPYSNIIQIARDQTMTNIFGLENNTQVSFGLQAGNDSYTTNYSSCTATNSTAPPAAGTQPLPPTNFTATAPDPLTINLNWTPATSGPTPDSVEIWYKIIPATGSVPLFSEYSPDLPGASTSYTVNTTPGTKMSFTIRVVYWLNAWTQLHSSFCNAITITTPVYACNAPTNLSFQILKGPAVLLTWTDNSTNETGFCIERDNGDGKYVQIAQTNANATSYQDNTVKQNSMYNYRVRAIRTGQTYPYSTYSNSIYAQVMVPSAPIFNWAYVSSSQIYLTWYDNDNTMTGYTLQKKNGSSWSTIATLAGGVASYMDASGLSPNTTYQYQINAYNGLGSSAWVPMSGTTLALPIAPSNLKATAASSSQINLSWNDNSSDEAGFLYRTRSLRKHELYANRLGRR